MPKKQIKKSTKKSVKSTVKKKSTPTKKTLKKEKKETKVKTEKKVNVEKSTEKNNLKEKYIKAVGRRKTSTARVRFYQLKEIKGKVLVNDKEAEVYFTEKELNNIVSNPIQKTNSNILEKGGIKIIVRGGGKRGQAEAIQLGIARILLLFDEKLKTSLKANSLLTRDSRKKERKKFGLKKARKAPQFSKR